MKFILLFFFIFITLSCSNYPNGKVGIYVVDMRNHENMRYRIIRLINRENEDNHLIISRNVNLESFEHKALADEIEKITSVDDSGMKELIGRDIALAFSSNEMEQKLSYEVGYASHCYLYYLKGHFVKKNEFYVEQYHLIPARPKCINNYNKDIQVK